MSNKQQTAVEWCIDELYKLNVKFLNSRYGNQMTILEYSDCKEQIKKKAKEMEKEQNKNYLKEYFEWHKSMGFVSHKPQDIIEFNETYGGNK
jgi:hypothetical protein